MILILRFVLELESLYFLCSDSSLLNSIDAGYSLKGFLYLLTIFASEEVDGGLFDEINDQQDDTDCGDDYKPKENYLPVLKSKKCKTVDHHAKRVCR